MLPVGCKSSLHYNIVNIIKNYIVSEWPTIQSILISWAIYELQFWCSVEMLSIEYTVVEISKKLYPAVHMYPETLKIKIK